jgi:2TM domain
MEVIDNEKDNLLWRIARRRATFKSSLAMYLIINAFLWSMWYFTSGPNSYAWPIWSTLGWGIGIAMHYYSAYHSTDKISSIQKEYDKLKKEQQKG